MDELVTVAGFAITIPGVLEATWTILKAAYDLHGNVDTRRRQIGVLLNRCRDLVTKIAKHLADNQKAELSPSILSGVDELQRACEEIKAVLELLKQKGFLWCMLNQDKIDNQIVTAEHKISDAFEILHFIAHIRGDIVQQELRQAQTQDRDEFVALLAELSSNDERILAAIQDQTGLHKRVEDLLVAVLKHVETLDPRQTSPEAKFFRSAGAVLQRRSSSRPQNITADWVVSSLDVEIDAAEIGKGSFGRVFKGTWTGTRVAVKQMYSVDANTLSQRDRTAMYHEIKLWAALHHPNILELYGACLEATLPFLIMRYCSLGNLRDFLPAHTDANRVDLSYDIAAGMSYLHGKGIIHADLKGANIMVDDRHVALVADFGLSLAIHSIRTTKSTSTHMDMSRGTLRWMAPECLTGERITKESDVYSLGVTIWEVFSEDVPFAGVVDLVLINAVVNNKKRPPRPARLEYHDALWALVERCWADDPESRPSINEVQSAMQPYTTRLGSSSASERASRSGAVLRAQAPSATFPSSPIGVGQSHSKSSIQQSHSNATLRPQSQMDNTASVVILDVDDLPQPLPPRVKPARLVDPDGFLMDNAHFPVLQIGELRFWAFTYDDDRMAYAVLIYDSNRTLLNVLELPGGRYLSKVRLSEDGVATFVGQNNVSASISFTALLAQANASANVTMLSSPDGNPAASVVILNADDLPRPLPVGVYPIHLEDPNWVKEDNTHYPVLKIDNFLFWAFSYKDDRMAYAILVYDENHTFLNAFSLPGARWLHKIEISEDGLVKFIGQGNRSGSILLTTLQEKALAVVSTTAATLTPRNRR